MRGAFRGLKMLLGRGTVRINDYFQLSIRQKWLSHSSEEAKNSFLNVLLYVTSPYITLHHIALY